MERFWGALNWLLIGAAAATGIFALIASIVGCFFPRAHMVSRTLKSKKPPEMVWSVITDFAGATSWHPELKTVERQPDRNGHEVWREADKRGYAMQLETLESFAPRRLVRSITDENGPFHGQWEIDIARLEGGSQITLTEKGQIPNPFFRFLFRLLTPPTWYIDLYLNSLAAKLGDRPGAAGQ